MQELLFQKMCIMHIIFCVGRDVKVMLDSQLQSIAAPKISGTVMCPKYHNNQVIAYNIGILAMFCVSDAMCMSLCITCEGWR